MRKLGAPVIALGAVAAIWGGLLAPASSQDEKAITLFDQPSVNHDSIWMALVQGYYKDQGLRITERVFPSGTTALQAFASGQGDIITAGDLPSVQYFLKNPDGYRAIAVLERDSKGYIAVASKNITNPKDLVGKTVATRVGSTGSWFVSEYLTKNGVDPSKVTVKNLDTQLLPTALCRGDIAAFFIWQPFGSRALEICPDNAHYLTDATGYINGYVIVGARSQALATPDGRDRAIRFLRATMKGRNFAENNFAAVAAYTKEHMSLSEQATREQWQISNRSNAFDAVFNGDFCSLSRWAGGDHITDQKLDLAKFTWPDGLQSIDQKLVTAAPPPC